MKRAFLPLLLIISSLAWCYIDYQPISGDLLEHWNSGIPSDFPIVNNFDTSNLPNGINELNDMFYPGNYYNYDEMTARILRSMHKAAGDTESEDNLEEDVRLFDELTAFLYTDREWFTAFADSLDYVNTAYSEYMDLGEYAMIINNYAYFLEQADDLDKSLVVLQKVLVLKPERMVAYINIADVIT